MEAPSVPFDIYDLSRVICFLQPDSPYAILSFAFPHNHTQVPPRLHDTDSDAAAHSSSNERETTPIIGVSGDKREVPILAITTDIDRLFDPTGHVLGSDCEESDFLLDDSKRRGVSAKHLRLFIDPEEERDDSLTLQNLSENTVRVISHEQRINENLTQGQQILLAGGSWSIYLRSVVPIVFKVIFPDHGVYTKQYRCNWSAFYAANLEAIDAVPTLSSMNINRTSDTPLVKDSPYLIDWTDKGILGKGSFGTVRKASSRVTNEVVATKIFKYPGDIQQELGFLQTLRHRYIIVYRAFVQERGFDILVMEYLEGGSLHDILRQSDPSAPIPRARLYWNQLARAVEFLHGNKVIHRDIKPSNVLFKSADRLKLCDFGISKQLGASGETTDTQLGSPHYVAPEVFNGQQYTLSADIWSLGITVLDMYRLSPRKLETWRIAGSDDSAWKRWLSAVLERTQTLPQELSLLGGQLTEDPYQRRSAESLVTGLREEPTDRRSDSSAVAEAGKMAKRLLDPISGNDKRRAKNNTTLP